MGVLFIRMFFFALLISSFFDTCLGQCYLKIKGIDTLINNAVDLFHCEKYEEALQVCQNIINKYPENPMGYLGAAVIYHGIMKNYWINQYENKFDSLLTIAILKGERATKKFKDNAECHFVYGAALGIRGLHRIRKGAWWSAFLDGISGYRHVKKAHEINNDLYDAYFGLGLFYYWKSAKARALTFLRLMTDEREKGIEYIKIAVNKGKFSPMEGHFYLVQIYFYEKRFDNALDECLILQPKFSMNPTWLYFMAKILEQKGNWNESQAYYKKLLNHLHKSPFLKSNTYLSECHYGIANAAFHLGNYYSAIEECHIGLKLYEKREINSEINGPVTDFEATYDNLKKLNEKLKPFSRK